MYEQDWAKIQEVMVCNSVFCNCAKPSPLRLALNTHSVTCMRVGCCMDYRWIWIYRNRGCFYLCTDKEKHFQTYNNVNKDETSLGHLSPSLPPKLSLLSHEDQQLGHWLGALHASQCPLQCIGDTSQLQIWWQAAHCWGRVPAGMWGRGTGGSALHAPPVQPMGYAPPAFGRQRHATAFHFELTLTQTWSFKVLILRLIRSVKFAFRVFWSHQHPTKKSSGRAARFWLRASCTAPCLSLGLFPHLHLIGPTMAPSILLGPRGPGASLGQEGPSSANPSSPAPAVSGWRGYSNMNKI